MESDAGAGAPATYAYRLPSAGRRTLAAPARRWATTGREAHAQASRTRPERTAGGPSTTSRLAPGRAGASVTCAIPELVSAEVIAGPGKRVPRTAGSGCPRPAGTAASTLASAATATTAIASARSTRRRAPRPSVTAPAAAATTTSAALAMTSRP